MAYTKTNFRDGDTLTAAHMNKIESGIIAVDESLKNKQDKLYDRINIKTINGQGITGPGNIEIKAEVNIDVDSTLSTVSTNPIQNKTVTEALNGKQNILKASNFKTVNGESVFGAGEIIIPVDDTLNAASSNAIQNQAVKRALDSKQTILVSGTNIKTVNGQSLLGSGNITVESNDIDTSALQEKLVSGTNIKTVNGRSLLGSGNISIEGSGGESSSFIVELTSDEICDYYAINSTGNAVSADGYGCTSFIPCVGCVEMHVTNMQLKSAKNYGLAFYDENKTFLSFVKSLTGSEVAGVWQEVTVPEGAHYFKATFFDYETQKTVGKWRCTMFFSNTDTYTKEGKRPYQDGFIWFSQGVNQSITRYWETAEVVQNAGEYKATTGVIALPENYSPTGKPVPLILYAHGLSHYVYYDHWGANDTFIPQKQHWLDMGFAVMGCNGARNKKGGQFPTGICPQGVNAHKQCVDYVLRHYNVDPQIFIVAGSAGGALGWNYLNTFGNTVKAAVFISAWADLEYNAWTNGGAKSLFTEFLGFENTSTYEVDKTIGFDQKHRIITIGDKDYCFMPYNVPIYGLYGGTETTLVNPMKKTFAALRNAGANARIRGIEGCGHEIVSGANIVVDAEIGNWFLSHWGEMPGKGINTETHTITYEYVDESGMTIKPTDTLSVLSGTVKDFASDRPTIEGYEYVSVSPTNATVTEDITVRFVFKKVRTYTVTYEYKDGSGTTVKDSTSQVVNEGTVLSFAETAPVIEGYTFASVTPETVTVTSDLTVTYLYREVDANDLTSLFKWDRQRWMAVSNPQWKSSSNFMSCFTDLSAYAGKTIELTVPQYTASNGVSSTGMTAWHTQPTEAASSLYEKAKIWDVDTNGNGKGVLVPIQLVVPANAPYLWTSTYMDGVAAYVGPNSGREDFYCRIVE